VPPLLLLAQCASSAPCELPSGLPWYFGAVIGGLWLAAVVGVVVVGRRYLLQKAERRRSQRDDRASLERSTPGNDLERW
jgi:hypothetical protein